MTSAASRTPTADAFRCGADRLSYQALDDASDRLAYALISAGLQPGDRVGVFMPRHVKSAIAVYGIMKAGGIFVPIDPHLPANGVRDLIADCEIRHLITLPAKHKVVADVLPLASSLECVITDGNLQVDDARVELVAWDSLATLQPKPLPALRSTDPAYIMYSSGSTGKSKGITHTHASGLAYCRLSTATYNVVASDVIANHSPMNFDMSTFGYFVGPYAGATTVIVPEAHTKFPASLGSLIEEEKITIWYSVPLALVQLLQHGSLESRDCSSVRWVKFGGECFPPKYLKPLMGLWSQARFSNVYGPAEVNQCTHYHIPAAYADDNRDTQVPLGEIWDETDGLVVDAEDQVIVGEEIGELVICSPTMMSHYWGRSSAETPMFTSADGKAYYRTGDMVRRGPQGLIFLGRKDRQVKVRGYRVELDEVEHAITKQAAVEEAAVFCVSLGNEKQIWAAAIARAATDVDANSIREQLLTNVSAYAVPSRIEVVTEFPRTSSGKVDRVQLRQRAEAGMGIG